MNNKNKGFNMKSAYGSSLKQTGKMEAVGSMERRAQYDKLGWAYDETIPVQGPLKGREARPMVKGETTPPSFGARSLGKTASKPASKTYAGEQNIKNRVKELKDSGEIKTKAAPMKKMTAKKPATKKATPLKPKTAKSSVPKTLTKKDIRKEKQSDRKTERKEKQSARKDSRSANKISRLEGKIAEAKKTKK